MPAYVISEVECRDPALFDTYRRLAADSIAQFGGRYLARGGASEDSATGVAAAVASGCTVLVVPCDVEVEPGERRIFRDSLVGVDLEVLKAL